MGVENFGSPCTPPETENRKNAKMVLPLYLQEGIFKISQLYVNFSPRDYRKTEKLQKSALKSNFLKIYTFKIEISKIAENDFQILRLLLCIPNFVPLRPPAAEIDTKTRYARPGSWGPPADDFRKIPSYCTLTPRTGPAREILYSQSRQIRLCVDE